MYFKDYLSFPLFKLNKPAPQADQISKLSASVRLFRDSCSFLLMPPLPPLTFQLASICIHTHSSNGSIGPWEIFSHLRTTCRFVIPQSSFLAIPSFLGVAILALIHSSKNIYFYSIQFSKKHILNRLGGSNGLIRLDGLGSCLH